VVLGVLVGRVDEDIGVDQVHSAIILALGDGEHLAEVIDVARKTPAQR
jgi:hypothetical protein